MDIRLKPEDRIGGAKRRKGNPASKTPRVSKSTGSGSRTSRPKRQGFFASLFGSSKPNNNPRPKTTRAKAKRQKRPLTFWRIIGKLTYWGLVLGLWVGIGLAGIVAYYAVQLPASDSWSVPTRPANIRIVATNGQLISNRGQMGGEAVAFHELPHYVPAAVLAIEDRRFFSHFGIDILGISRALIGNIMAGRITSGGSTITQQVAKNLFLTPDQNLGRKVQEALLAIWLERNYSKTEILELYLNRVYFGAGSFGIEAAAHRYFGKSARNLSLGEAAIMAGLLKAPSRLSPDRNPEQSAARARVVLGAMAQEGYISKAEAEAAAIDPNKRIRTRIAGAEFYVADWVESLMTSYIGEVGRDVIVTTTIDWDLQKRAEFTVREMVAEQGLEHNFSQGALVSMNTDGAVVAIVGGVDYSDSQYNRAVTARRQPGSSFKPFVYLAALEAGLTPDSMVEDAPLDYNGWKPENYNQQYAGPVTLRQALAHSLNTVAGRLAIAVGPQAVIDTASKLGISSQMLPVPSIALGTAEVSLLELTGAYAPLANGGNGVIAHVITRIETTDGQVLYQNIPAGPGQVVSFEHVAMMNDMLSTALDIGTGKRAQLEGWEIAGKTGTTQSNRDAVFVGYSANFITGVWLGNDDNSAMTGVGGGSFPVDIWSDFMTRAHQDLIPQSLPGTFGAPPFSSSGQLVEPSQDQRPEQQRRPRNLGDLINELFGNN